MKEIYQTQVVSKSVFWNHDFDFKVLEPWNDSTRKFLTWSDPLRNTLNFNRASEIGSYPVLWLLFSKKLKLHNVLEIISKVSQLETRN